MGGAGAPIAGLGGASGVAGSSASSNGGAPAAGSGGTPIDLGPPGPDGFAVQAQLASDLKATAPTTVGIVRWSLDAPDLTEAHIDFGLDTTYGMTAPVELALAGHRTVLVGMKPAKTYHFRVVASAGSQTYTSDDHTLTTGAPLSPAVLASFTVAAPEQLDKGFFITSFWSVFTSDTPVWMSVIVDTDGDVVWWYRPSDYTDSGERGIARARLSADSRDLWLVQVSNGGGPLRRVSIDTLEEQTYEDAWGSHDIAAVEGGTMAYIDYRETDCDSIFEIDRAGEITEIFEPTGVTHPTTSGCHGNAVRYSKKEDVYVYSDHTSDVVVVARDGTLEWKLSDLVSGGNTSWGGYQHGVQLLDGSLLVFANRAGGELDTPQAIEFGLDGSVLKKFASRAGGDFLGDVQRLPSGNTLIDYSFNFVMQVVDPTDSLVLEMTGTSGFGYVEFRERLYGEPLDIQQ